MDNLDAIAHLVGHNWLALITAIIVIWLMLTRLAETSEAAAKLLGPLGKRMVDSYHKRQKRYRQEVADEAKMMAIELMPKVVASDYQVVKDQLHNIIERVGELEQENIAMRSFIVDDEQWHFHDDLSKSSRGEELDDNRIPWMEFVDQWKKGWRPRSPRERRNGH